MSTFIDLLRQHRHEFEQDYGHHFNSDIKRAISAMLRCKTEKQGLSQWYCSHCHHDDRLTLSCGNRHCPQCQHRTTSDWLERQKSKLLPVHYYMVTFTLPYELRSLARSAPRSLYQAMFRVASSTLKDFAHRQTQGELGFTIVLHTHSRKRELHPHLHVIVAGGQYDAKRHQWFKGKKNYLFNEFALAKVWRARMLESINQTIPAVLPRDVPSKWVVDCRCVGYGLPALQYLSRYLYRGVLPDKDIKSVTENEVTFEYVDGKTKQRRSRTLPITQFLWLILQHVLPKGLQRVRDYGFLRGNAHQLCLQIQLLFLSASELYRPVSRTAQQKVVRSCPCCHHEMACVGVSRPS
ncbi:transposase [Vibrio parahaemolyticus]|nr:transposase [Vibrio parahaemolyticus]